MKPAHLFLKPEEGNFLSIAVVGTIETLEQHAKDPTINWTPKARKQIKEMLEAGRTLRIKLEKLGFNMSSLPDVKPGEENDYLTKES